MVEILPTYLMKQCFEQRWQYYITYISQDTEFIE